MAGYTRPIRPLRELLLPTDVSLTPLASSVFTRAPEKLQNAQSTSSSVRFTARNPRQDAKPPQKRRIMQPYRQRPVAGGWVASKSDRLFFEGLMKAKDSRTGFVHQSVASDPTPATADTTSNQLAPRTIEAHQQLRSASTPPRRLTCDACSSHVDTPARELGVPRAQNSRNK